MEKKRILIGMTVGIVVIGALVFGVLFLTRNTGKTERTISAEEATASLDNMMGKINPSTAEPIKSSVEYSNKDVAAEELPELSDDDITVRASTDAYAEVWASPEKAGQGSDGWMREMAEGFNSSGAQVGGKPASVQLRSMSSGLAVDYIASGKASPAGYSPSNSLFVELLKARGGNAEVLRERTVGNVAGITLKKDKHDQMVDKYGSVDLKAVTEAVADGSLTMGYTDPFTSSTGLNFLMSCLLRYDSKNPLSEAAVDGFKQFQTNVPFVALTTVQMRDAAEHDKLDGFVMEWQLYQGDPDLQANYVFTPFGYRHDNPLVACKAATEEQRQILEQFAQYCDDNGKDLASKYGFNGKDDYVCELPDVSGETLVKAQELYKKNKDNDRPVMAVFVADVSGSMTGKPLSELKDSLINSMRYINDGNYVGLVSYSDDVTIEVPIDKFDLNQQAYFKGAVENLQATGQTATYDGIIVAASMLKEASAQVPNAKTMIFLLSDGDSNAGYVGLGDMQQVISGLRVPVYTIGYNADIDALQKISAINEAASIDATTDDVTYQLKNLFNANM